HHHRPLHSFPTRRSSDLKMTPSWVGTDPKNDIPVPDNVRRYYLPSSTHGGGNGTMTQSPSLTGASCPGNNWGTGVLRANPVPVRDRKSTRLNSSHQIISY